MGSYHSEFGFQSEKLMLEYSKFVLNWGVNCFEFCTRIWCYYYEVSVKVNDKCFEYDAIFKILYILDYSNMLNFMLLCALSSWAAPDGQGILITWLYD